MKKLLYIIIALSALVSCIDNGKKGDVAIDKTQKAPGDSALYGLAAMGCNDTCVVFLPNEGGDPVIYNTLKANKAGRVLGKPEIGDWVAIIPVKKGSKEAYMVVDLDQLKATWTYQVLPELKESAMMTEMEQRVMMARIGDSLRALWFVPREYGFTLKRHGEATTVGMIMRSNTLDNDSPVEYPPLIRYNGWTTYNGKLILIYDPSKRYVQKKDTKEKLVVTRDTADIIMMREDTLVLKFSNGKTIGYHKQENATEANKAAQKAAEIESKAKEIKD